MQETKYCPVCKRDLAFSEFHKSKNQAFGLAYCCRACIAGKAKAFRQRNAEKIKIEKKAYYERKKQEYLSGAARIPDKKICPKCKVVKAKDFFTIDRARRDGLAYSCKECNNAYLGEVYKKNKASYSARMKKYRDADPEKTRERKREHYLRRREHVLQRVKRYRERPENREKKRKYGCEYMRKRRANDPLFRLLSNIRGRVYALLKRRNKSEKTMRLLGCTLEELFFYMEERFYDNPLTGEKMTWENYGKKGWDADHVIPVYYFDLSNAEEQHRAFHVCNMQPMWEPFNSSKNNLHPGDIVWGDLYDAWVARQK
jgi:hypothetical protein